MKKRLLFILFIFLYFPSGLMAALQEDNLMDNVFTRFQAIITERGGDPESIVREDMAVVKSIPFEVELSGQDVSLYAVKIVLSQPESGQKQHVTLIVDETGNVQLDGALARLNTGRSMHQEVMDELERLENDPGVGDVLFQGSGDADVLYLSDPFCPYCRNAYSYLLEQKDRINELKIAHFPVNQDSGAVALSFLMMEFKEEDIYQQVVDFAYELDRKQLTDNADLAVIRIFNQKFEIYTRTPEDVFEALQEKHGESLSREMEKIQAIGLSGTPVIIIDGIRIDGFNRDRVDSLLDKAMK